MNDSSQNEAETAELKYQRSPRSSKDVETNKETSNSRKDPDTMVSMTVLLLACLALAILAHVVV